MITATAEFIAYGLAALGAVAIIHATLQWLASIIRSLF